MADPPLPGELQELKGAVHIHIVVEDGLCDGGPDPSTGSDVGDGIDAVREGSQTPGVPDVASNQGEGGVVPHRRQIPLLDGRIVEVVEVVQADDLVPLSQESFGEMGRDKAGHAGEKDVHVFLRFMDVIKRLFP